MKIIAVPDGPNMLLDCDECGPLGVVPRPLVHTTAQHHLTDHGIEVPMDDTCTCGYNYAHVTGHEKDLVTCTTCTWSAVGATADHQGHHHHLDTHHIWEISMGNKT